jgi:hypothetical protein
MMIERVGLPPVPVIDGVTQFHDITLRRMPVQVSDAPVTVEFGDTVVGFRDNTPVPVNVAPRGQYLFYAQGIPNGRSVVAVVAENYWRLSHSMPEAFLSVRLPFSNYGEYRPGVCSFGPELSTEAIRAIMLNAGFSEDPTFSTYAVARIQGSV